MPRSPVTDLVQRYNALTDEQQKLFLDMVDPQPEPEPVKQTRKKRGPSKKAQSLSNAIAKTPKVDAGGGALCVAQVPGLDVLCGNPEDALIHDPKGGYTSYHPFVAPAQPAVKKSRQKGAVTPLIPNTVDGSDSALSVSSGGD